MKTSSSLALALAVSLAAFAPSAGAQSAADRATARDLYKAARALREKGDPQGALDKFKAAHALAGTPITALELGRTYALTGQLTEALDVWLSVARIEAAPKESSNAKAARKEAAALAEQTARDIPTVVVKVEAPAGSAAPVVSVDRAPIPGETLGLPRRVNPGQHEIVASLAGFSDQTRTITVRAGETQTVSIVFASPAPVAPPPTPPPPASPPPAPPPPKPAKPTATPAPRPQPEARAGVGPVVYAGFGVGAAGLLLGSVAGVVTLSEKASLDPLCTGLSCDAGARDVVSRARTWATLSTVGFVVGGVGLATGLTALVLRPRAARSPAAAQLGFEIAPAYAGLKGSF